MGITKWYGKETVTFGVRFFTRARVLVFRFFFVVPDGEGFSVFSIEKATLVSKFTRAVPGEEVADHSPGLRSFRAVLGSFLRNVSSAGSSVVAVLGSRRVRTTSWRTFVLSGAATTTIFRA